MTKYNDLKNQHVFITGGASGIGAGLVEAFLDQGSNVSMIDIDQEAAETLLKKWAGYPLSFFQIDISKIDDLKNAIKQAKSKFGSINTLINNAANDERHQLENLSEEKWDQLISINLKPFFFAIQEVITDMKKRKSGNIINFSSNSYLLGLSGYPSYITAKAGIVGLTKTLAREYGEFGIRVNAILPGWVMTEKQKKYWVTDEALKKTLDEQSIKAPIEVEDISQPTLFLASEVSRMITGQSIVVDGGRF